MTVATTITLLRLSTVPPLALLILNNQHPGISLVIFTFAAASDWADGLIARRFNQVTQFGARLDALVDKLFIFAMLLLLAALGLFWWPLVVTGLLRDSVVEALRQRSRKCPIPANRWGKRKFMLQCVAVAVALLAPMCRSITFLPVAANIVLALAILAGAPGAILVWRAYAAERLTA